MRVGKARAGAQYGAGVRGEDTACEYLASRGMTLVEKRYRAGRGEIDLVMADGDTLVFAEVKYRPFGRSGDGLIAVTPEKRRRIINAAQYYLMEHGIRDRGIRFDAVEITADGIRHVPNAFSADG